MRHERSVFAQLVGVHVSPPSHEYCTVYATGTFASCEYPTYSRPSVPTYGASSPGGPQRTSTEPCSGLAGLGMAAQPVCFESANCFVSDACVRGPPKVPAASGF